MKAGEVPNLISLLQQVKIRRFEVSQIKKKKNEEMRKENDIEK